MTLNMKNYKGYNKEPYCNAHYPTTKFTAVADTPEARRLMENTKIQSQVQYHAEFEKQKGRKIEVTDDPELLRHQKNTAIMSNVAYHGVLEQKEGQEKRRATLGDLEEAGMAAPAAAQPVPQAVSQPVVQQDPSQPVPNIVAPDVTRGGGRIGSIADYDPLNNQWGSMAQGYSPAPATDYIYNNNNDMPRSGNAGGAQTNGGVAPAGVTSGPPPSLPRPEGRVYKAIYDYQAQDDDEIGFFEGDLIINCEPIDEGWMQGMHKKSGQVGMLPANYVELVL